MSDILYKLDEVLKQRKAADSSESYVSSLHEKGLNEILEKVGEEAVEAILAGKDFDSANTVTRREAVIKEAADLCTQTLELEPSNKKARLRRGLAFEALQLRQNDVD